MSRQEQKVGYWNFQTKGQLSLYLNHPCDHNNAGWISHIISKMYNYLVRYSPASIQQQCFGLNTKVEGRGCQCMHTPSISNSGSSFIENSGVHACTKWLWICHYSKGRNPAQQLPVIWTADHSCLSLTLRSSQKPQRVDTNSSSTLKNRILRRAYQREVAHAYVLKWNWKCMHRTRYALALYTGHV